MAKRMMCRDCREREMPLGHEKICKQCLINGIEEKLEDNKNEKN